jgi:hypothetical protein
MSTIPGYTLGTSAIATSPVTLADFDRMKATVLFGEEDVKHLRLSHDVVKDEVEAILDVWYGIVGSQPHLLASFSAESDDKPLGDYLGAVRRRFGQWILDTARAEYDQRWLDYQHEIGLRHHFALVFPVTFTLRPFLEKKGHSPEDVEKMHAAWVKSCLLQVTLWSHPYVKPGDF